MVDVTDLSIYQEIKPILNNKINKQITYHAVLSTPEKDLSIRKLLNIDITRDYGNYISDHIHVTFQLGLGDYHRYVFPFRSNLELLLYTNKDNDVTIKRYKLIITNTDIGPEGGIVNIIDKEKLNTMGIVTIEANLLDIYVEVLRGKLCKGIYHTATLQQAMVVTIGRELEKIIVNDRPYFEKINIITPNNKNRLRTIIIRDGLYVLDLPNYLQEKYGIYSGDIGIYFQTYKNKHTCFIYPPYDYRLFDIKAGISKLIVNVVPSTLFDIMDRTYMVDGDMIRILTGESTFMNHDGEREYMDSGNAILQSDSRPYMKKPVIVDKKGPIASYSNLNYRVGNKSRDDGVNINNYENIGSNVYISYSKIMRKSGIIVKTEWNNPDIDLLYPGMPVLYQYNVGNNIRRLKGLIHKVHLQTNNDMIPKAVLYLFLEKR